MITANLTMHFDSAAIDRYLEQYKKLEIILCAGTISLKAMREILQIDRYVAYNIYLDLLEAGAIYATGSSMFRATPELRKYMEGRRADYAKKGESEK